MNNVSFMNVYTFNELHTHTDRHRHTHVSRYNTDYTRQTLYCVTFVNNYGTCTKYTVHGFATMARRPRELTEVDRQQMIDRWTSLLGLVC